MDAIITSFALLMTLSSGNLLEVTGGLTPDGRLVVVGLFEGGPNDSSLVSFEQLQTGGFRRTEIVRGPIFSLAKALILVDGYLYFSAVRNFNLWLFRLIAPGVWQQGAVTSSGDITGADMIHGNGNELLGAVNTAIGEARILSALSNAVFAAIAFTVVKTIAQIASPFLGASKISSAYDPDTGRSCHLVRQLAGTLVAACLLSGVLNLFPIEVLPPPIIFDGFVESAAAFKNGLFFFTYYVAGLVRFASVDPVGAAVTAITLGAIAISPGQVPGLALAAIGAGLYAFWPGAAVQILLPLLTVVPLANFPITKIGPIAAVVVLQLGLLAWILGSGSLVATQLIEGSGGVAAPLLSPVLMVALSVALFSFGFSRSRRAARRPV